MNYKIIFIFLLFVQQLQAQTITEQIEGSANGKTIPDFYLQTTKGDSINLYSLKADYIFIDIWATWCGPCKAQAPTFDSIRLANADKNWIFISVSIDDTAKPWLKYLKKKNKIKERQYLASDKLNPIQWFALSPEEPAGAYSFSIPKYIILDKNYLIVHRDTQIHDGTFQEAVKALAK